MSKQKVKPLARPGYTMFNNHVLDHFMPDLSGNGWKVLCVAIRQTWGWKDETTESGRKEKDRIAYSQFMEKTGIKSSATLSRALKENLSKRYLLRNQNPSYPQMYDYCLNQDYEIEVETSLEIEEGRVETSLEIEGDQAKTSLDSKDTKESTKETIGEKKDPSLDSGIDKYWEHCRKTEEIKKAGDNYADPSHAGGADALADNLIAIYCQHMGEALPKGGEIISCRAAINKVLKAKGLQQDGQIAKRGMEVLLDPDGEYGWYHDKYTLSIGNKLFVQHYGKVLARLIAGGDGYSKEHNKKGKPNHVPRQHIAPHSVPYRAHTPESAAPFIKAIYGDD